jgi:U32 family peptidase
MPATSPERIPAPATTRQRPELLAPAGDWECARAAVENGADAIYFGLEKFNARMRAKNFTAADLPDLMSFLHRRGARGYVTFNTLVFQNELADAEAYLKSIIAAGVDAAIVQDIGICRLIRELSPDFPIHASTQMTISSAAGVNFARELGCNLVVLARECSLKEISAIRRAQVSQQSTVSSEHSGLPTAHCSPPTVFPLEVFVHGALCVAYSGQCLTSEVLGGRSANRGECAQACRLPYELISDGRKIELGDRQYLLSPQDLAGIDVLPELVAAGVSSLKIEGRLKAPEYVASITRIYREALDRLEIASSEFEISSSSVRMAEGDLARNQEHETRNAADRYELEMSFSRGLYTGWFRGNNNQELAHARFGKKRGVYLGEVKRVERQAVVVQLISELKPGDGIVFDQGNPEAGEEGGRVYQVSPLLNRTAGAGLQEVALAFGQGAVDFARVYPGDKVWKTSDPELERRIRQTFEGDQLRFQRPVHMEVHGRVGHPLHLLVRDEEGHAVEATSNRSLTAAEKTPLTRELLEQQLGRLGGTPFRLGQLESQLEGDVILPVSELNRLRRDAVERLDRLRAEPRRWTLRQRAAGGPPAEQSLAGRRPAGEQRKHQPQLTVLCRSLEQLRTALEHGITTLYADFENPKGYREAVELVRAAGPAGGSTVRPELFVAPPRIFKMGEDWILKQVRSCDADGYLVRNYDHLQFFADDRKIGDFSLNVANALTAEYFMTRFGLERLTASYDLNAEQLAALLRAAPPNWFEVTLHQHMPMFHMEHCVFCAFLSKGRDYRDCGRPCDKHVVKLRDRVGMEHPLKADVGCRNTLFNARAQTGAEFYSQLFELGVRQFRIEFVNESAAEVTATLSRYRALLRGEITGADLWRELKLHNQLGVTRGQMGR